MQRRFVLVLFLAIASCATQRKFIGCGGGRLPWSPPNEQLLKACEEYRLAVERGDADALMRMAHQQYWENHGTPSSSDDYGYEGLRSALLTRLHNATNIRYSVRYVSFHQQCTGELVAGCRAAVDVLIERDQKKQLVLAYDGGKWLFLSGM